MSKKSIRIIALILAAVIFGGAIYLYQTGYFEEDPQPEDLAAAESQPAAGGPPEATPVRAILAEAGLLRDQISVNGSTLPPEEVVVTSEVPGKVTRILFQEGAYVTRGAPLVQLDIEELQAQRERLLVQQELTGKIAERLQSLYEKEGVSLQEYEIARAEADQVAAELALLDVQIEKHTVRAPFNGTLGLRQISEGSYLSPGMPIVNLVNINPIHVEFSVPEKYSQSVDRGATVEFQLDGTPGLMSATVIAKEPNIDPATRTLKMKASAPNPGGRILPGAFARVTVNLAEYDAAILIPTQAVVPELGGKKVFVYRNGTVEAVPVETGIRKDAYIQVNEGLAEGDTVITTGVLQIRSGSQVTITGLDEVKS